MVGVFIAILLTTLFPFPRLGQAFIGQKAPEISSTFWINSKPRSLDNLRGKVVMVEFWTFGCYNCRNVEPQIKQWHQTYSQQGLVVIGVHSPEFSYEKNIDAVKRYVRENGISYTVAIDNDFTIWKRYSNRYWPAIYLIDKKGFILGMFVQEKGDI